MAMISWRTLSVATVCLVAASLGAASDMYDEMLPGDMSLMYQDQNYIDPGNQASLPETREDNAIRSLLLYKMLSSMRDQDVSPNVLAGPKWVSSGTGLVPPETFDLTLLKGPVMKRISETDGIPPKPRGLVKQPVPKWKIKKGKAGKSTKNSQMFCYFKLCAFRPAV